jgi:TolB-like protein
MKSLLPITLLALLSYNSDANAADTNKAQQGSALYHPASRISRINDYLLDDYAEQLAMRLVESLATNNTALNLAVTSFVDLDDSLQKSSQLGNQFAESMLTEVQTFGLSVVDHKVMPIITRDNQGDYIYSRDLDQLKNRGQIDAVLSGTLLYKENGVMVNSRITRLADQKVIASAKYMIPYSVAFEG